MLQLKGKQSSNAINSQNTLWKRGGKITNVMQSRYESASVTTTTKQQVDFILATGLSRVYSKTTEENNERKADLVLVIGGFQHVELKRFT